MGLPASLRVNIGAPFPALVQGSGPIVIGKLNGVWTVGFNIQNLAAQTPLPANYANDYLIFFDANANTFFKAPFTGSLFGRARVQRSVTATPIVLAGNDEILNCNINAAAACALPAAASRAGLALTFVDVGLQFGAHNLTITPNGAERIVNWPTPASIVLNQNGQALTLNPFNDGTNSGWFVT